MNQDLFYLAATMWGEARGEGAAGMRAVGHVILNRKRDPRMRFGQNIRGIRTPPTIKNVVLQPKQFSCWNKNDPNRDRLDEAKLEATSPTSRDGNAWRLACILAEAILDGRDSDTTGAALYYHTDAVNPSWDDAMTVTAKIGNHIFYR